MKLTPITIGGLALISFAIILLGLKKHMSEQLREYNKKMGYGNVSLQSLQNTKAELEKQPWNERVVWETVPSTNSVTEP